MTGYNQTGIQPNYGNSYTWPNAGYGSPYTWQPASGMGGYSQPRQQTQPTSNLLRVTGPESAKAYSLPPNSSVVLFDADNPIFYLKSTDDSGFATLRTFEFVEKTPEVVDVRAVTAAQQASQTATDELRGEVDGMKTDISEIKKMLEGLVS